MTERYHTPGSDDPRDLGFWKHNRASKWAESAPDREERNRRVRAYNEARDRRDKPKEDESSEEQQAKPAFEILTRSDLRSMPRVGWLIKGLVQTSGLVVLGGDGGVGKSAVAIDWAASIASGRDWYGRRVRAGNVLYIAGEGVEGIEDRLVAWETVAGVSIPDERLEYVAEDFSLGSVTAVEYAREVVAARDYDLVILDTLSQLSGLENENDNAEMSRVMAQAKAIRQARPGTTVLIVHHTSKGGRLRGASTLRNNADAVIMALASVSGFRLSTEQEVDGKQKNGPAEKLDGFWLDQVGGSVVVRRGGQDPLVSSILALVADGQEHSGEEFYSACVGVPATDAEKKAVRRARDKLVADGVIIHNGASTTAARWQLGQP